MLTETCSFNVQNVIHMDELTDLFHKFLDFLQQHFLLLASDAQRHREALLISLL